MIEVETAIELRNFIGIEQSCPQVFSISRDMLSGFLELSGDQNPIHQPELGEKAVVPGNLLLAILPRQIQNAVRVRVPAAVMSVSYRRIKFVNPVQLGAETRLHFKITHVRDLGRAVFVTYEVRLGSACGEDIYLRASMTDRYGSQER